MVVSQSRKSKRLIIPEHRWAVVVRPAAGNTWCRGSLPVEWQPHQPQLLDGRSPSSFAAESWPLYHPQLASSSQQSGRKMG